MSDLISRQAALDIINSELNGWLTDDERLHLEGVGTGIECLPTIDPVKHGKWLITEAFPHHIYCSACSKTYIPNDRWQIWVDGDLPRDYCPNCGAKMDGGK